MAQGKYDTHVAPYMDRIGSWLERGATQAEVAAKLHIGESTLRKYLDLGRKGDPRYVDLAEVWVRACEEPDDQVEGALYKRATGMRITEAVQEQRLDRNGDIRTLTKITTKDVPPDTTAALFWLANRRPTRWSYKPEEVAKIKAAAEEVQAAGGVIEIPALAPMPEPPPDPEGGQDDDGGGG